MTKEDLFRRSRETFDFVEQLNQTDNFLSWAEDRQNLLIGMIDLSHRIAQSRTPLSIWRDRADTILLEMSQEDAVDLRKLIYSVLDHAETLRYSKTPVT